ncbi:hypothetical protein [Achromobacter deleyi]|uniref:hypothetical protein n=1 Tax=Achromobacter deleyi TaxID=1353891 RepID=UPI00158300B7|nr:hypothetical protein [Achromobacter deleyi]
MTGWNVGFNKVQFGSLLREYCGFSLSEGKKCVDSILKGKVIELVVDEQKSVRFLEQASQLGAICELGD